MRPDTPVRNVFPGYQKSSPSGVLPPANGGTGLDGSAPLAGALLIGSPSVHGFALARLIAGSGMVVVNGDGTITLQSTGGISLPLAWADVDKTGSSLADLATRSAADLSAGNLALARLGLGVTTAISDTSTGAVTNWAPALAGDTYIEWAGAADATFQGLTLGVTGSIVTIKNTGSKNAFFAHLSGTTALAKFRNMVTSGVTPIAPGGYISYISNGTDWMLLDHKQGAPITIAFDATKYSASGSMTWTVDSGDVNANQYLVDGRIVEWLQRLSTTTVGGTPDSELHAILPNGYTCVASSLWNEFGAGDNTSSFVIASGGPVASQAYVRIFKDMGSGGNWTASTNNTFVNYAIRIPVN